MANLTLTEALNQYVKDPRPETETLLIDQFVGSTLLIPAAIGKNTGQQKNGPMLEQRIVDVQYQLVKNATGQQLFPVFSNRQAYNQWQAKSRIEGQTPLAISIEEIWSLLQQASRVSGVVIDMMTVNLVLDQRNVAYLTQQLANLKQLSQFKMRQRLDIKESFIETVQRELAEKMPFIQTLWALKLGDTQQNVYVVAVFPGQDISTSIEKIMLWLQSKDAYPKFDRIITVGELDYTKVAQFKPLYNAKN
ncbi:SseB family protein [Weissella diestrammenae]|uniref:SseB family protein n=1 Tax=Weissella diestrammenae TaxID=1162633 RepID=A0A7G9T6K4_9LACO|nr:SseB family protein [Weissella diestrammenae]MCM0582993.1 SseB family protein [Weissella diestrammenae]QNN75729.1 SseB family protein [Weissella diestrammenae]